MIYCTVTAKYMNMIEGGTTMRRSFIQASYKIINNTNCYTAIYGLLNTVYLFFLQYIQFCIARRRSVTSNDTFLMRSGRRDRHNVRKNYNRHR